MSSQQPHFTTALEALGDRGQSVWLDFISRKLVGSVAHDTAATLAFGRFLWERVARPSEGDLACHAAAARRCP